eukprot:scaffold5680_cov122-Isochrysis_galbana.AAC.5
MNEIRLLERSASRARDAHPRDPPRDDARRGARPQDAVHASATVEGQAESLEAPAAVAVRLLLSIQCEDWIGWWRLDCSSVAWSSGQVASGRGSVSPMGHQKFPLGSRQMHTANLRPPPLPPTNPAHPAEAGKSPLLGHLAGPRRGREYWECERRLGPIIL